MAPSQLTAWLAVCHWREASVRIPHDIQLLINFIHVFKVGDKLADDGPIRQAQNFRVLRGAIVCFWRC